MTIAGTCISFSTISFVTWGIDYATSYKDFSLKEAALSLAVIALLSLVLGVLAGGYFADLVQKRVADGRVLVIAGSLLGAAPFLLLARQSVEKWVGLAGLFVAGLFIGLYTRRS